MSEPSQRTIVTLGMHRSGTSMLAGSFEEAGVSLGHVVTDGEDNRKGNRENRAIMAIHEDLFERAGGSWDNPPDDVHWASLHREVRSFIIAAFRNEPVWGFKDPRTVFTADGWIEALPNIEFAGIFRHPLLVARSLQVRDGFSIDKGVDLWTRYNAKLLVLHDRYSVPLIEFEDDPSALDRSVAWLVGALDLPGQAAQRTFFEDGLRHKLAGEVPLPPAIQGMYEALRERSAGPPVSESLALARTAVGDGNDRAAYRWAHMALRRAPEDRAARLILVDIHQRRKQGQQAFELLVPLLDERPEDREVRARLARLLVDASQFQLAAEYAGGGVDFNALSAEDAPLLLVLSTALTRLGRVADGEMAQQIAYHLAPHLRPADGLAEAAA